MKKNILNEEEQIESFIEWLRYFFSVSAKQKSKLIKKISKKDKNFSNWLVSVMDFDFDMQDHLIEELRYSKW